MATLIYKPLLDCTLAEISDITSEHWCWTIRHLEEKQTTLKSLIQHDRDQVPTVLHQHHHGEQCTRRCLLAKRIEDAGMGGTT